MRLGVDKPDEWKTLLPYLNQLDLDHVTLHPRVAKQQYGGEVDLFQFDEFLKSSKNPVVYNGDLRTPADIVKIETKFPDIKGIMLGRGVLGRPTLIEEGISGIELEYETRLSRMIEFHRILFSHYSSVLCGDTQIINKIKPFWEYSEEEIGRKAWKAINKSSNLAKYQSAVALIHL